MEISNHPYNYKFSWNANFVPLKKKSHCKILQDASNIHTCTSHNLNAHHQVCNKSNTTGNICGVVPAYTSGAPEFTPGFQWGSCCSIFSFLCNVL